MSQLWRHWISRALFFFKEGLHNRAGDELRQFRASIAQLDPDDKMRALGMAAQALEAADLRSVATSFYEELIALAQVHHPRDIRTAREWVRLAGLYAGVAPLERQLSALENADRIYSALDPVDIHLLQPGELEKLNHDMLQTCWALSSQQHLEQSFDTPYAILTRMADILRNDFKVLTAYPDLLVQQIHNGLSPFRMSDLLQGVVATLASHQEHRRKNWCSLSNLLGPGRNGWLQRQFVTRTYTPNTVRHITALGDNQLFAITEEGTAWVVPPGGVARPVIMNRLPKNGKGALASVGNVFAIVDKENVLRFCEFLNGVLVYRGAGCEHAGLVANSHAHFVATFKDGRVVRFGTEGREEAFIAAELAASADVLFVPADGNGAILVKNSKARRESVAQIQIVSFDPPSSAPPRSIPEHALYVHCVQESCNRDRLLIGSTRGLYNWNPAEEFPQKGVDGTVTTIVRSAGGKYTAMFINGIRIIHHETGLQTMVPMPPGESVVQQLFFEDTGGETRLHVAVDNVIETWAMKRMAWYATLLAGWVERAVFANDNDELIAMSPVGFQYAWRLSEGKLLEMEKWDHNTHMISWAPDRSVGAVCSERRVELFNGEQRYLDHVNDTMPHDVSWDGAGRRLVWAGAYDFALRWAERTPAGWKASFIEGEENYYPLSPVLSPDGSTAAYIRGHFRMADLPEMGLTVKMGVSGRSMNRQIKRGLNEGIALINLETGARRLLLADYPNSLKRLWFASDGRLFAADDGGCVLYIETRSGEVLTRFWAAEPVVAGCELGDSIRVCDTGMTAAFGPVIYDFKVHIQGKGVIWH